MACAVFLRLAWPGSPCSLGVDLRCQGASPRGRTVMGVTLRRCDRCRGKGSHELVFLDGHSFVSCAGCWPALRLAAYEVGGLLLDV